MCIRGTRRTRLIALAFLSFCLLVSGISIAARRTKANEASDAASLEQELRALEKRKARAQRELREVKRQDRRVTRQLSQLDTTLSRTEARLGEARRDADGARVDLEEAVREYRAADARLADHRENVSDRLVAVYEQGEMQPVAVLLESASFTDLMNRLYLLNQVVECDAELLGEFEGAREEADERRSDMARRAERLTELEHEVAAEKQRVSQRREQTQEKKARLLASRAEWERALFELEQNSREVTAMLQRLQRTSAGQARLVKPWKGSLARPVKGRVSSGFGYRVHPIFRVRKMHTGIDIAAPRGTAIQAAADGVVIFAGRWGGYGNCVIIDHGGGLATLYGHCSAIRVSKGQEVSQNHVIGTVGSTGLATGPHLHFETRRDGRPVDPNGF